jgi:LysM repeat protein
MHDCPSPPVWNPNDASTGPAQQPAAEVISVTPTPDPERVLPTLPTDSQEYFVAAGDSLQKIAKDFGVDIRSIIHANELENPDLIVNRAAADHPAAHTTRPGRRIQDRARF